MYKEKFLFSPNYWLSAVGLPSLSLEQDYWKIVYSFSIGFV
jgi:hypothetical protein